MAIGKNFSSLSQSLGYTFSDDQILENALTHSSYSNEYKNKGLALPSNERLEFLGDAVLEIVISEYLYNNFKSFSEGKLTRMRQKLVCEKTLAEIAFEIKLGEYIHLGKGEEIDCRTRPKVLADTLEAVIGAIYIDSGSNTLDRYKEIIISLFLPHINKVLQSSSADYKTLLQQFVEKDGSSNLEYVVTEEKGPEHDKKFYVDAKVNNNVVGRGVASNKKDAEKQAAKHALELFGLRK